MKLLLISACLLSTLPASAADREFNEVVRVISQEFHTRPTSVPLMGLVNFVTAVAHPAGTRHIDIAIFEHLGGRDGDSGNLMQKLQNAVGRSWTPFIKVRSYHHGDEETVLVYMRQEGPSDWRLLITAVEPEEATVVQLRLNPEALAKWVKDPETCARHWHGEVTE
jgi:hypothetical protein